MKLKTLGWPLGLHSSSEVGDSKCHIFFSVNRKAGFRVLIESIHNFH